MTRVTLIDNYDSFTFNLFHDLGKLGAEVTVIRNDDITTDALIASAPDAIVLSPGPGTPNDSGICLETIEKASKTIPIFGVCLGMQAMGQCSPSGENNFSGDQRPLQGDALPFADCRSRIMPE